MKCPYCIDGTVDFYDPNSCCGLNWTVCSECNGTMKVPDGTPKPCKYCGDSGWCEDSDPGGGLMPCICLKGKKIAARSSKKTAKKAVKRSKKKHKNWWLKKIGLYKWQLRYSEEKTVFETFECGTTAIQVRAMLNRHDINPKSVDAVFSRRGDR